IRIGLAVSLKMFSPRKCPDPRYKLMRSDEPVVNVSPQIIDFDASRGTLRTNVGMGLYFGTELSFPRVISLDRDKHERLYDTSQFPTFELFKGLKSRLQKVTRPCRIRSPSREHRTPIRITDTMRETMRNHPGLHEAGLGIV